MTLDANTNRSAVESQSGRKAKEAVHGKTATN